MGYVVMLDFALEYVSLTFMIVSRMVEAQARRMQHLALSWALVVQITVVCINLHHHTQYFGPPAIFRILLMPYL